MFNNVGEKIETFAKVIVWLGIIGSIIGGIIFISSENIGMGIAIIIGGPIVSWLSSLILYGFGQLIENSDYLVNAIYNISSNQYTSLSQSLANDTDGNLSTHKWRCPKCNQMISSLPCEFCGYRQEDDNTIKTENQQEDNVVPQTENKPEDNPMPYKGIGHCELCNAYVEVTNCKILDSLGARYRKICAQCIERHNATPVK